jgi:Fur family ferric uptake transcriptional regulator
MKKRALNAEAAGLRSTRQRTAILEAVTATPDRPVTAQDLHSRLRSSEARPGLATVYRTLQALTEAGLLRTFPTASGEIGYKVCRPGHHHHLICTNCGRVDEIPSCDVEGWARSVARRHGYVLNGHEAEILGVCPSCARRRTTRPTGS